MRSARVTSSRPASALIMVVALIWAYVGFVEVIPSEGPAGGTVGICWTLVFVAVSLFHALNLFTGFAAEKIVIEGGGKALDDSLSFDERLRRLERLREERLLTEREYQRKREEVLRERW